MVLSVHVYKETFSFVYYVLLIQKNKLINAIFLELQANVYLISFIIIILGP